jgi:hypothetical protein
VRLSIPEISGRRGAGLGNELFPWAKAFLAGQALDARVLAPAWGLNARGYRRDFGASRLDWLGQAALRLALPVVRFDEADYLAAGGGDYQEAVARFAAGNEALQGRHVVFSASGMWGGFEAIGKARLFVLAELLKARRAVANTHAVLRLARPGVALVAVHVRRGDFSDPVARDAVRGRFNVALPLEWYMETCASLRRQCGGQVDFALVTDARPDEIRPFLDTFRPLTSFHLQDTACSDLLLMAFADALVCSVSSYSMWGAFLSGAPYLWCAEHLQDHDGFGSLWGHEAGQAAPHGPTARKLRQARADPDATRRPAGVRGLAVDWSGQVPAHFCERLLAAAQERAPERDLLRYGVVPLARERVAL